MKIPYSSKYGAFASLGITLNGIFTALHSLTQNVDYKAFPSENNFAVTTVTLSHHLTYYITVGLHEMLNVTAKRI